MMQKFEKVAVGNEKIKLFPIFNSLLSASVSFRYCSAAGLFRRSYHHFTKDALFK